MRKPLPFQGESIKIVDGGVAGKRRIGFSIQNVGAVDVYYSDDQRSLDQVGNGNIPTEGHLLPASTPVQPPTVYIFYNGKPIFARGVSAGALVQVLQFEIDLPCS